MCSLAHPSHCRTLGKPPNTSAPYRHPSYSEDAEAIRLAELGGLNHGGTCPEEEELRVSAWGMLNTTEMLLFSSYFLTFSVHDSVFGTNDR